MGSRALFQRGNRANRSRRKGWYRCVYCSRALRATWQVVEHERVCPLRRTMKAHWTHLLTIAKQREVGR